MNRNKMYISNQSDIVFESRTSILYIRYTIYQMLASYGLRAKSGLWTTSIWPLKFLIEKKTFKKDVENLPFIDET